MTSLPSTASRSASPAVVWVSIVRRERKCAVLVEDEAALTAAIVARALQYGRYGYRRITAMLRRDGWTVTVKALDVIDVLSDLFSLRGVPSHIRSDNGPAFIAKAVRDWIAALGSETASIEPGSPWENGCCESFDAKRRDARLNEEVFYTLKEATIVIEQGRTHDNSIRPHSSLAYQPPAPELIIWQAGPVGSVPPPQQAIVTPPTMHELQTQTTECGQAN